MVDEAIPAAWTLGTRREGGGGKGGMTGKRAFEKRGRKGGGKGEGPAFSGTVGKGRKERERVFTKW